MLLEKKIDKINFVMDNTLMNDIKIWSFTTFLCLGICMSSLFGMESLEVEESSPARPSASFTESTDGDLPYNYDKIWENYQISVISSDLNSHHLEELFNNKYAALRVRNFLTEDECERLANVASEFGFDSYQNVQPRIDKIGITQFEASKNKSDYFDKVNAAESKLDYIYSTAKINVINRVMGKIRDVSKKNVSIAREKGQPYFAGLIRRIQRAFIHFDFAKFDAPDWEIRDVESQLSWNIYLKTPQRGGETIVYEFPWSEGVGKEHQMPKCSGSYGFSEELVRGRRNFPIQPTMGDLVIFNTRNFHEVKDSTGERLSISSFFGLNKDEIIFWS